MNLTFIKTIGTNTDFQHLVTQLDLFTKSIDKEEFGFYAQFNSSLELQHVVLAYINNEVVACGAIKKFSDNSFEVKRMFVLEKYRGKNIAGLLLKELELWAIELGALFMVLETGQEFESAVALYTKMGYTLIPNYGQYIGVERSICFQKQLI
jgi:putative acetyltransferase